VHPDLLPVIRSRFYLESVLLQSRVRGGEGITIPQQVVGEHLALSLVYDLPQAMRSILQDDLEKWGVSFYEAAEPRGTTWKRWGMSRLPACKTSRGGECSSRKRLTTTMLRG